jgi:hypothetical protein
MSISQCSLRLPTAIILTREVHRQDTKPQKPQGSSTRAYPTPSILQKFVLKLRAARQNKAK